VSITLPPGILRTFTDPYSLGRSVELINQAFSMFLVCILYRQKVPPDRSTPARQDRDLQHRWKLHEGASKGESSLMVQIRTEKIGFRAFLAQRRVPEVSPECDCREAVQTPKHVILACPNTASGRVEWLQRAGTVDYRVLTSTREALRMIAQRIMGLGLLQQFNLATKAPAKSNETL
jgi:hypothetical protein